MLAPPHAAPMLDAVTVAGTTRGHGLLRLRFTRRHDTGCTVLHVDAQQPPLRVIRAFELPDDAALVHLHNVSGGVLGGDHLETHVDVAAGARVQLTSTSATRLYRSRADAPNAVQHVTCRVGKDALLEYLPDPLIPFAGARYVQRTTMELAEGAGLFWWEVVAPGRSASRELFAYELLELHVDITAKGIPVAIERIRLAPSLNAIHSPIRLGRYRYFATFYVCRVGIPAARWLELERQLAELAGALSRPNEISWGVSTLPAHGLVVRALAVDSQDIAAGLASIWNRAKCELYGQAAIPPRKIY